MPPDPAVALHADAGRLLLRHDDAGRPGHLGGRPRRRRLRADRGRPGRRRGRRRRTRCAGRRATTRRRRATAARATSTTPPSRPRRCAPPGTSGSRSSTSTPTTATAPQAIFYDRADVLYGSVHVDPGAGWFPHVVGYADETGTGAGRGRHPQPAAARGHRRRGAGSTRSPSSPDWVGRAATPWSSRSASTRPPTTRRARCRSPPTATARPAGCSGRPGSRPWSVQEGGYHLPSLGGLVAAYLDGHAPRRRFHRCARSGHVSAAARNDAACRSRHRARGSAPTGPRPRDRRGRHRRVRRTGRRAAPRGRARDPRPR